MDQDWKEIPVVHSISKEQFDIDIYPKREPVVLRGMHVGRAVDCWNAEYLASSIKKSDVKIHVSPVPQMNFLTKNFKYKTLPFDEFVTRASQDIQKEYFICENEKYYLRSVGADARKDVADIRKDFPELADDINFPEFFEPKSFFSSVFRISSKGVQLWTHYDVMDNFLIQIIGTKRVVLYSPADALNMYLEGDKSRVVDIDDPDLQEFPNFRNATRHQCILEPGDTLLIPALWFHNVTALDFCVGVNVFWKHLPDSLYDKKDIYGNKDPVPASRAIQSLNKTLKQLAELPKEYADFYARRMIQSILDSGLISK